MAVFWHDRYAGDTAWGEPGLGHGLICAGSLPDLSLEGFFLQRKITPKTLRAIHVDPKWSATLLSIAMQITSWGIFTWLQLSSDRWAMQAFSNA